MKFALTVFVRLNIFAFCVFLNLHEAEGLPPVMSRFLNRFVYRRGKGKRHAQRYRPAVFDNTFPADTEIVFRLANNFNVPSVDYSQIDFGQTYQAPPVDNAYLQPPPAPISLHHYNSVPTHYSKPSTYYSKPSTYYSKPSTHYSKPSTHSSRPSVSISSTSSNSNPGFVSGPQTPLSPSIVQQTPSQFISSLKLSTELEAPRLTSAINSGLQSPPLTSSINSGFQAPPLTSSINSGLQAPPLTSSINSGLQAPPLTSSINIGLQAPPSPSSINSSLNIDNPFLPVAKTNGDLLPLIEIGKTPPPNYRVADNFQQSFQVTLTSPGRTKKKRDLDTSEYTQQNNGYATENRNTYLPAQNNYKTPNLAAATFGYFTDTTKPVSSSYGYSAETVKPVSSTFGYLTDTTKPGSSTFGYLHNVAKPASSYGYSPETAFGYLNNAPVSVRSKQGSIVTRNKIYFSPRLLAHRSQPFQIARRLPPGKPFVNVASPEDETHALITNITAIVDKTKGDSPNFSANKVEDDKTYVSVRLQSYSTLKPPGNDSDLLEAQKDYGFGGHTFLFGNTDSLLSVFEMLLRTDFDSKPGHPFASANTGGYGIPNLSSGNSLEDTIDCINNFVNATERIHFWAHSRGESDAANLFQVFPRDPIVDAIPFIDTATVTDTLSATVF